MTSNLPLRAGKGFVYEGGIRVPLIVRWPGVSQPGSRSDVPVTTLDVAATLLRAAKPDLPAGLVLDGFDRRSHSSHGIQKFFFDGLKVARPGDVPLSFQAHESVSADYIRLRLA